MVHNAKYHFLGTLSTRRLKEQYAHMFKAYGLDLFHDQGISAMSIHFIFSESLAIKLRFKQLQNVLGQ